MTAIRPTKRSIRRRAGRAPLVRCMPHASRATVLARGAALECDIGIRSNSAAYLSYELNKTQAFVGAGYALSFCFLPATVTFVTKSRLLEVGHEQSASGGHGSREASRGSEPARSGWSGAGRATVP